MPIKLGTARKTGRRLRIATFGAESVGKTHLGLSGRRPVAWDSEGRIDSMVDVFGEFPKIEYDPNCIAADLVEASRSLRAGTLRAPDGEPFETFVIDSWTTIEKEFKRQQGIDTTSDDKVRVKNLGDERKLIEQQLLNPVLTGPTKCHIYVTAHQALLWNANTRTDGWKPDATRNFKHYFDIVLHMQREAGNTQRLFAVVVKSNYQHIMPIGQRIEKLSWEHFADIINDHVGLVPVPTTELKRLHREAGSPDSDISTWLRTNGFQIVDRNISPEDSHRAKGMLQTIIEDSDGLPAEASA